MKTLNDYMDDKQTEAFNKYGEFFAFGTEQFNEAKKNGVKYTDVGLGLICPVEHVKVLLNELGIIHKNAIKQDLKENTKDRIILRELYNYECFFVDDITDAVEKLTAHNITIQEVRQVYINERISGRCYE